MVIITGNIIMEKIYRHYYTDTGDFVAVCEKSPFDANHLEYNFIELNYLLNTSTYRYNTETNQIEEIT